jgi:hypothetical protein
LEPPYCQKVSAYSSHILSYVDISLNHSFRSVSARLHDSDLSCLREARCSAHSLQYKCLRILSPPTGVKEAKGEKPSRTSSQEASKTDSVRSPSSDESRSRNFDGPGRGSAPARKIRRPVSIRRPKLIGKSVDGSAIQAVAASRKRATSKQQFKNASVAATVRRPPNQNTTRENARTGVSRTSPSPVESASKAATRPPQSSRNQKAREDRDETLVRVNNDFTFLCSAKYGQLRRQSSLQREAMLMLANVWWPRKPNQTIPRTVGDFIVSKAPITWSDACRFPPLPKGMIDIFVTIFARWIAAFTPGLDILPTLSTTSSGKLNSVLLSSGIKNVRGCKCLAVVRISKSPFRDIDNDTAIVRCEGWVINLPRRAMKDQIQKLDANVTSLLSLEKDSAGMDKLTTDMHVSFNYGTHG